MLTHVDRLEFLKKAPIFQEVKQLDFLEQLAPTLQTVTFDAGEVILTEGEERSEGALLYMLMAGRVQVYTGVTVLAILKPGDFFGEMSIFSAMPPTASVKAIAPCECLVLQDGQLYNAIHTNPGIGINIIRILCNRIHRMNRAIPPLIPASAD